MTAYQKLCTVILMTGAFLIVGQLYVTLPMISNISAVYGVDPTTATLVGSSFGLAYALGFLVSGPLSDRFGRVKVIFYGMLATAVATFLVAKSPSFSWLVGFRIIQGVCAASFPPAALSLVAEMLPQDRRPLGISLISLAFLGAAPLAQFIGAQLSSLGTTRLMLEVTPLYLVFAFIFHAVFKTLPSVKPAMGNRIEQETRITGLFSDAGMVFTWLAAPTVLFGFVSFHASLQAFNTDLHLNLQIVRLFGLPTLLLTLFASRISKHYGAPVTAMAGLILSAAAFGLTALANPYLIYVASAILCAGVAFALPGLIGTVASRTKLNNRGFAMAVYSFTLFLGASIASPVVLSLQSRGLITLCGIPAIFLVAAMLGLNFARKNPSLPAMGN